MTLAEMIERNDRIARRDRWLLPLLYSLIAFFSAGTAFLTSGMIVYAVLTYEPAPCPAPAAITMPTR